MTTHDFGLDCIRREGRGGTVHLERRRPPGRTLVTVRDGVETLSYALPPGTVRAWKRWFIAEAERTGRERPHIEGRGGDYALR